MTTVITLVFYLILWPIGTGKMVEWSKTLGSGPNLRKWAWVQIPLLSRFSLNWPSTYAILLKAIPYHTLKTAL